MKRHRLTSRSTLEGAAWLWRKIQEALKGTSGDGSGKIEEVSGSFEDTSAEESSEESFGEQPPADETLVYGATSKDVDADESGASDCFRHLSCWELQMSFLLARPRPCHQLESAVADRPTDQIWHGRPDSGTADQILYE